MKRSRRGRRNLPRARPSRARRVTATPKKNSDAEKLSRDEKRRLLAKIVRVHPADCFDATGAFDLERVREIPGAAIQQVIVHEIARTDRQGNSTVQRRITLRLVDKVRAMRFDEKLLEGEEEDQETEELSEEQKKAENEAAESAREILKSLYLDRYNRGTPVPSSVPPRDGDAAVKVPSPPSPSRSPPINT